MNTLRKRRVFMSHFVTEMTVVVSLFVVCRTELWSQSIDEEMMKHSSVVFVGTITKLGAATFSDVQVSANTSVVKVDELLQRPAAVSISAGQEITLELKTRLPVGTQATFYADGWILGKGIALREVGHVLSSAVSSGAARDTVRKKFFDSRRAMTEAQWRARIDAADVIALGEVVNIRPSSPEALQGNGGKRITEHDANWHDAVVKVSKAVKGVAEGAEIVVRFPASMDVAFYGVPKFKEGDEKLMMLALDSRSGLKKAVLAGKEVTTCLVTKPSDVLEKSQLQQVIDIMRVR